MVEKLLQNPSADLPEAQDGSGENPLVLLWKLTLRLARLSLDFRRSGLTVTIATAADVQSLRPKYG